MSALIFIHVAAAKIGRPNQIAVAIATKHSTHVFSNGSSQGSLSLLLACGLATKQDRRLIHSYSCQSVLPALVQLLDQAMLESGVESLRVYSLQLPVQEVLYVAPEVLQHSKGVKRQPQSCNRVWATWYRLEQKDHGLNLVS